MTEIIDQDRNPAQPEKRSKLLNSIVIGSILAIDALVIATLINSKAKLDSPFLPEYTIFYMHSGLINFAMIQSSGLIPALILRLRNNYSFSTYSLLAFFIAGLIFKDLVRLHEMLY